MPRPTLLCHGGVGADPVSDYQPGVDAAADIGLKILQETDSALKAVLACVAAMEDDELFNAGTGSYMKLDGAIAMDALVAEYDPLGEGHPRGWKDNGPGCLRFGGVAAIQKVRNPVLVAARVMDTPARLLVGEGAITFARQQGFEAFDVSTEKAVKKQAEMKGKVAKGTAQAWAMQWAPWLDLEEENKGIDSAKASRTSRAESANNPPSRSSSGPRAAGPPPKSKNDTQKAQPETDTVGAVAIDGRGCLAAANSTGGLSVQIPGRVGDSPLWGAGLFAGPEGALVATGIGEAITEDLTCQRAYLALASRPGLKRKAEGPSSDIAESSPVLNTLCRDSVDVFPLGIPVALLVVDSEGHFGWADNDEGRLALAVRR